MTSSNVPTPGPATPPDAAAILANLLTAPADTPVAGVTADSKQRPWRDLGDVREVWAGQLQQPVTSLAPKAINTMPIGPATLLLVATDSTEWLWAVLVDEHLTPLAVLPAHNDRFRDASLEKERNEARQELADYPGPQLDALAGLTFHPQARALTADNGDVISRTQIIAHPWEVIELFPADAPDTLPRKTTSLSDTITLTELTCSGNRHLLLFTTTSHLLFAAAIG